MSATVTTRAAALRRLVEAYRAADEVEAGHRSRLLELLDAGEAAFSRDSYVPGHVTASAFVLSPARDALLLIHHRKLDIWVQPGGHVDPGDAGVVEAARREVAEEVGLADLTLGGEAIFDVDIHPIPARGDAPRHEHFDVRCLLHARGLDFAASDEVKAARWARRHELDALRTDESVRRAARKIWG